MAKRAAAESNLGRVCTRSRKGGSGTRGCTRAQTVRGRGGGCNRSALQRAYRARNRGSSERGGPRLEDGGGVCRPELVSALAGGQRDRPHRRLADTLGMLRSFARRLRPLPLRPRRNGGA